MTPDEKPFITRRQFLKGLGASAGLLAAGVAPAMVSAAETEEAAGAAGAAAGGEGAGAAGAKAVEKAAVHEGAAVNYPGKPVYYADPPAEADFAMVIDVKACVGCRECVYACMRENNIGRNSGFTYIQVLEMEPGTLELEGAKLDYAEGGSPEKWYLPVQCMHCEKPPCVYGCPVQATWREPDGIVVIDYKKCIACRNCMITCPYSARHFNWIEPHVPKNEINPKVPLEDKAGVVEKCTFCIQRTRNGLTTRCVEACPVGARKFGDLNDPDSEVSEILRTRRSFRLKEELGTEPAIWYVG
jgi:molybdopterin-containing oxidoreductase family iron-sulfur binding subunit